MVTKRELEEAVAILLAGRGAQLGVQAATATRQSVQTEGALRTAARGGRFVGRQGITSNPWGVAALLAYQGYIHRDEVEDVARSLLTGDRPATPGFTPELGGGLMGDVLRAEVAKKPRRKSTFNKAVSASYQALKKSRSYGKPGVVSSAKRAFAMASKAASKVRQGKPMPKAGPSRIAYRGAKTVYSDYIIRQMRKKK